MKVNINGTLVEKAYDDICKDLGFVASVHFVDVNTRGNICWTAGKPEEIRALKAACLKNGYRMSAKLHTF